MVLLPRNSPKTSFGLRPRQSSLHTSPGPGHYESRAPEVALRFSRTGATLFGTSVREGFPRPSPGPGAYTSEDIGRKMKCSAPAYTCSPRLRIQETIQDGPAPVDHCGDLTFSVDAPKYSIANPRSVKGDEGRPGPADYAPGQSAVGNPILASRAHRMGGFGSEERMRSPRFSTPGPGSYSKPSTLGGQACRMALPQKLPSHASSTAAYTPGPGAYSSMSDFGEESVWQHVK
mmetsp:Transcript_25905/g.46839  ORF Transcript_25905/g.46839 Transcript_25905/m.46839 type:complete len:232 (-) Transcript_25905:91-786(-)